MDSALAKTTFLVKEGDDAEAKFKRNPGWVPEPLELLPALTPEEKGTILGRPTVFEMKKLKKKILEDAMSGSGNAQKLFMQYWGSQLLNDENREIERKREATVKEDVIELRFGGK